MYKNIVVPVDVFDAGLADKALSHAKFLAQHSAGQIHLIHVIPAFSPVLTRGFISDARKMEDHLLNTAKEKLSELVKKKWACGRRQPSLCAQWQCSRSSDCPDR